MTAIANILRNKWFWIAVAIVVLFFLLRGPAARGWAALLRLSMKDGGDYAKGFTDGAGNEVTGAAADQRKSQIEGFAQEAFNQLNAAIVSPTGRERALEALVALNDTELRHAAKHYKLLSRDKTLHQAVDSAWMPLSSVDETLLGRLSNIAMI
jgi:hypothetical protein